MTFSLEIKTKRLNSCIAELYAELLERIKFYCLLDPEMFGNLFQFIGLLE